MPTGAEVLKAAVARLQSAHVPDPQTDARRILAHCMGIERARLTLELSQPVPESLLPVINAAIARRCERQPVSHILGYREFWGRRFEVSPDVLDPRPDTELIIELALQGTPPDRILDLGTGSGILAVTLAMEFPNAKVTAVDISDAALNVARRNARDLGAEVEFLKGNWFDGVTQRFDLIVSNPPYITEDEMTGLAPEVRLWEPEIALTPGGDGLAAYRAIIAELQEHLSENGRCLLEIGYKQAEAVIDLCHATGLSEVAVHRDMAGKNRVIEAKKQDGSK